MKTNSVTVTLEFDQELYPFPEIFLLNLAAVSESLGFKVVDNELRSESKEEFIKRVGGQNSK